VELRGGNGVVLSSRDGGGGRQDLTSSWVAGRGASSWRRDLGRPGAGRAHGSGIRGGRAWGELGVSDGGGRVMCSVFETIERKTEVEPAAAALLRRSGGVVDG
jgi:hypothetical protein